MEIVATTKDGVLIQATTEETREIIRAVSGKYPEKLDIGQRIPAIDYAGSITKIKQFKESYNFKTLIEQAQKVNNEVKSLEKSFEEAVKI